MDLRLEARTHALTQMLSVTEAVQKLMLSH